MSSISSTRPSDATLEQALQRAVRQVYKSGNLENLTVKRVRKTVENDLDLEEDFFKTDPTWTSKSKLLIQAEVDEQAEAEAASSIPPLSQSRADPPKPQDQHRKPTGTKRASTEKSGPKKRRKKDESQKELSEDEAPKRKAAAKPKAKQRSRKEASSETEDSPSEATGSSVESDFEDEVGDGKLKHAKAKPNGTKTAIVTGKSRKSDTDDGEEKDDEEEEEDVKPARSRSNGVKSQGGADTRVQKKIPPKEKAPKKRTPKTSAAKQSPQASLTPSPDDQEGKEETTPPRQPPEQSEDPTTTKAEQSDSSMSVLLDDPPKPKRSRKSSSTHPNSKSNPKPSKTNTKKPPPAPLPTDPSTEELKRLQSHLQKCGIRKMWPKYLSPYPTPQSKIKHLKQMLVEAGMTGRFSEGKAQAIKEERELRADLEAVQEGEKKWGMGDESGEGDGKGDGDEAGGSGGGGGRGKRALAKGFEGLGFLGDEGEETD